MEFGGLKVLMISSDRNICVAGSGVAERMKEYGTLAEELHIVVLSDSSHGLGPTQLSKNVWVYPTNSAWRFLRSRDAAKQGKQLIFDKKFVRGHSVITVQDPFECGLAGLSVKRQWRIPLEVQLHTDPFSPYFSGFLNYLRKRMGKKVLKQADSIRVVSEFSKKLLQTTGYTLSVPISVLPIYVDIGRIEEGRVSFDLHARYGWEFVVLSVARLAPEKNLSTAIRALSKLRQYYPLAGLVIVGEGPERPALERLVKTEGLSGNIVFAGWQEDLASYYRTANVFVQTSRFEGYGLALVEAALSGLPLCSTPVGLAQELENGRQALICPIGDAEYLFKALYDLAGSSILRDTLRQAGKEAVASKLLSKEAYLHRLKDNWERTAALVRA